MFIAKTFAAFFLTCLIVFLAVKQLYTINAPRITLDGANLRQIAIEAAVVSLNNDDKLPPAKSVTEFAIMLARAGSINDAALWTSFLDPARTRDGTTGPWTFIIDKNTGEPTPAFMALTLSVATPVLPPDTKTTPTMPIVWTRGLQRDGSWTSHAPYGNRGGYIAFLSGSTRFYTDLNDAPLHRFDGKGRTSDILETLPPGTHISEYTPSETEMREWAEAKRPNLWPYLLTTRIHQRLLPVVLYAMLGGLAGLLRLSRLLNQESFNAWLVGSAIPLGFLAVF